MDELKYLKLLKTKNGNKIRKKRKLNKNSMIENSTNTIHCLDNNVFLDSLKEILNRAEFSDNSTKEIIKKIDDYNEPDIRIALIGITSSGKSSLMNVFLGTGKDILKEQSIVTTNTIVYCSKSDEDELEIVFSNGEIKRFNGKNVNFDLVKNYSSEDENDYNKLSVRYITIGKPSFLLEKGIKVIDSPGLNAYKHEEHQDITLRQLLPQADIVLYLTPINTNLKQADLLPIKQIMEDDQSVVFIQTNKDSISTSNYSNGEIISKEEKLIKYRERQLKELNKVGIKDKIVLQIETTDAEKFWERSGIKNVIDVIKNLSEDSETGKEKRITRIIKKTNNYCDELSKYLQSLSSNKNLKENINQKELFIKEILNLFDNEIFNVKIEKWKEKINPQVLYDNIKNDIKYLSDNEFENRFKDIPNILQNMKSSLLESIDAYESDLRNNLYSHNIEFNRDNIRNVMNLPETLPKIYLKTKIVEEYHERSKGSIARLAFWRGKLRTHYKTTRDVIDRNVFYEELNDAITYYLEPILKYLDWWKNKIEKIYVHAITNRIKEEKQILEEHKAGFENTELKIKQNNEIYKDLSKILKGKGFNDKLKNKTKDNFIKVPEKSPDNVLKKELDYFHKLYLRLNENLFISEYFNKINKISDNKNKVIILIGNDQHIQSDFLSKLFKIDREVIRNLSLPYSIGKNSIDKLNNINLSDFDISFIVINAKEIGHNIDYLSLFKRAEIIHLMVEDLNQVGSAATELFENNIYIEYIKKYISKVLFVFPRTNYFVGDKLNILADETIPHFNNYFEQKDLNWFFYDDYEIRFNYFFEFANKIRNDNWNYKACLRQWKIQGIPLDIQINNNGKINFSIENLKNEFEEIENGK